MAHSQSTRRISHPATPIRRSLARAAGAATRAAAAGAAEVLESRVLLSSTLTSIADTFVRNHEYRTTNLGASPVLGVKTASSGDSRTAFLKFDIGDTSADVTQATLRLTASLQNPEGGPAVTGVFGVEDVDWVEGNGQWAYRDRTNAPLDPSRRITGHGDGYDRDNSPSGEMTWNSQPASDTVAIDTVSVDSDLLRTYEFDVTSYVRAARASGDDKVSLALKNPAATDFFTRVMSGEFPGGEPTLVITERGEPAAPAPRIDAANVTRGGAGHTFDVTFAGLGVGAGAAGVDDVTVLDPNGTPVAVTGVSVDTGVGAAVATYSIAAPGGAWDSADNGVYRVVVNRGAVIGSGGASPGAMSEFRVAVDDAQPPTVSIVERAPQEGETTFTFTATFTDDVGIDASTINLNNFEINNRFGTGLGFTSVAVTPGDNARTVTAVYTTEAPGGADPRWHSGHDGPYSITLRDNQVRDTSGKGVVRTTREFTVRIGAGDTAGPTATVVAGDVTTAGGASHAVRVDYADPAGLDVSTFGTTDLLVTGPGGELTVTGMTLASGGTDAARGVVYTVAAPAGAWDAADAGTYTVSVRPGEVKDLAGNGVAAGATDTFDVRPVNPDRTGPSASIAAVTDVTSASSDPLTVAVTYTDDVAVDPATIGADDVTVSGPAGALQVTGAAVTSTGGSAVTVNYTVAAPAGGFTAAANGTYGVAVIAGAVADAAGNPGSAASAAFNVAVAGGGVTDPSFNSDALRFTAQAVATQPDGKIVVAGYLGADPLAADARGVLERRNADGSLDTSFGDDGQVVTGAGEAYHSVIVQGNDRIVTAGTRGGDFALSRFAFAGTPDASFGQGGTVVADFGATDAAYGLAVAPDGKLAVVGESDGNFAIARFTASGAPDVTFAQAGKQLFDVGEESDGLGAVAVQGDGRIVAVGARGAAVAVVRLNANGEADAGFSGDGLLLVGGLTAARAGGELPDHSQAIALQPDGRIVVSNRTPDGDFGLARVTAGGNLDSTFGDNGLAVAGFGGEADVDALVVQTSGEILAVGTALVDGVVKAGVAAFDANGQVIVGFGEGGRVTVDLDIVPLDRELHVGDLVVRAFGTRQSDGRLVLGAGNQGGQRTTSALNRVLVPGTAVQAQPQEAVVGEFGMIDARKTKLSWTDPDGTVVQLVLAGAKGTAFADGDTLRLAVTDLGPGAKLTLKAAGGDGRVRVGDVSVMGTLKSFTGKAADLVGTMFATGAIAKASVGTVAGGTIASAVGSIGTVTASNLTEARILSGANLGADNHLGGGDDSYTAGAIRSVKVTGGIAASVIAAGYSPGADSDFLDEPADNPVLAGSVVRSVSAKAGADAGSRFAANTFGSVRIPGPVSPATDARFDLT